MTRLHRSISFFTAPALLALFGCGGEKTTGPVPTARINPSLASAGLAAVASRFYEQHNLVSDGAVPADLVDPALVNAWGLVASASSPWWIADNGTDLSTLYNGNTGAKVPLTVSVPSAPTGTVFNGGAGFVVASGTAHGPARFIFATQDGTILGWNPGGAATSAVIAVDHSASGAVYKGPAIASTTAAGRRYPENFP